MWGPKTTTTKSQHSARPGFFLFFFRPLAAQGLTHDDGKSENLPNWDPMSDDYSCPTFNCYKSFNVLASEPLKQR